MRCGVRCGARCLRRSMRRISAYPHGQARTKRKQGTLPVQSPIYRQVCKVITEAWNPCLESQKYFHISLHSCFVHPNNCSVHILPNTSSILITVPLVFYDRPCQDSGPAPPSLTLRYTVSHLHSGTYSSIECPKAPHSTTK